MPPAMTSGGFKSPAPVLPAMGLHSFHNDSPPFAAAATTTTEHPDPEHFSLEEEIPASAGAGNGNGHGAGAAAGPTVVVGALAVSGAITGAGLASSSSGHGATAGIGGGSGGVTAPIPQRGYFSDLIGASTTTTEDNDAELSASRSRRLVSGYRFGNPPSPVDGQRTNGGGGSSGSGLYHALAETPSSHSPGPDSPPLTEPTTSDSSPRVSQAMTHPDPIDAAADASTPVTQFQALALEGTTAASGRANRTPRNIESFDALTGLHDGEADLDETAPPADGRGTQGYLRGEDGDAGAYRFPKHRLRKTMKDESKIPLVIVACGSFSPPTYLHLRMFEMAKDEIVESQTYEIMAGYYSPVSSYYKKAGLAPAIHRVRMCELAVEHTSTWLMVDPWEAGQPEYQRTAVVLDHFDEMLNGDNGGVYMADGSKRKYKVMLLAGGDLIESFGEPGVWSEPDLHIILGRFGCLIVERAGSDVWAFLLSHDILYHHRRNVIVIKQLIYNDISSTKVRLFVRRGMSIKYLLPNSVIQYIHEHRLYREPDFKSITK